MSLRQAIAALRATPRDLDASEPTAWQRCLQELFATDASRDLIRGELASPGSVAAQPLGQLLDWLAAVPRGPQKAGVLQKFAAWWQREFGNEVDPPWSRALEDYRAELRTIRGLGPETADRLLLFGPGLSVVPVDRAMLRITVRHGWLDLPVADEQAQSVFLSGLGSSVAELQDGVRRLHDVGVAFCGRVADCEHCPLKSFLPEGGPLSPEAC